MHGLRAGVTSTENETQNLGGLLAAAAYAGADHGQRLLRALRTLDRVHGFRDGSRDPRCRTCRDSRGRPAPFPCATSLLLNVAMSRPGEGYGIEDDVVILLRNTGRELNGQSALPDGGVRAELAPYVDPSTEVGDNG